MTSPTTMSTCPTEETLAAFVDGRLDADARERVIAHLANCAECRDVVLTASEFSELEAEMDEQPAEFHARPDRRRVAAFAAIAASILAVMVAIPSLRERLFRRDAVSRVLAAVERDAYRHSAARLSAAFPYRPAPPVSRGESAPPQNWRLLAISEEVDKETEPSLADLHAQALAQIHLQQYDRAITTLERALQSAEGTSSDRSRRAALLNDLAVVHLERASRGEKRDLVAALDAVERSWRTEPRVENAWTRAVLLERMNLKDAARRAWEDYLRLDGSSPWAAEARTRLHAVPPGAVMPENEQEALLAALRRKDLPSVRRLCAPRVSECRSLLEDDLLREWASAVVEERAPAPETSSLRTGGRWLAESGDWFLLDLVQTIESAATPRRLAESFLLYADARRAYLDRRIAEAVQKFEQAEIRLAAEQSPLFALADVHHAGALHWANRYDEILPSFDAAQDPCRPPVRYRSACGFRSWMEGLALVQTGKPQQSIRSYEKARRQFDAMNDHATVGAILGLRANTLDHMTAYDDAWRDRMRAVTLISSVSRRSTLWHDVAVSAIRDGYPWAADAILLELTADARTRNDLTRIGNSAVYRLYARSRMPGAEPMDVREVQAAVAAIPDAFVRARSSAMLRLILAQVGARAPADDVGEALAFFRDAGDSFNEVLALEDRASALWKQGDLRAADTDLVTAIQQFQRQAADVEDPVLRSLFGERLRSALIDLSRLQFTQDAFASLWLSEAARLAVLPNDPADTCVFPKAMVASPGALGAKLVHSVPQGFAVIHQDLDETSLRTWLLESGRLRSWQTKVDARALRGDLAAFSASIASGRSEGHTGAARRLHQILFADALAEVSGATRLIYSPSGLLRALPVAALSDGRAYLAERYPLTVTRSLTITACVPLRTGRVESVLLVESEGDVGSARLEGAAQEVLELRTLYGSKAEVLGGGGEAQLNEFVERFQRYDLVHVAAHGRSDGRPLANSLEFGSARFRAFDALGLQLDRAPIVVLAACRSDDETDGRTNVSLSSAFSIAGASAVLGSLWDVDDQAARGFMNAFHQRLAAGAGVVDAMSAAQRQAIRSGANPRDWAGFQLHV